MNVSGNEVTLAATDGFRISVRKAALSNAAARPMTAIIPARALSELARIATDGNQSVTMILPPSRGQVLFHLKDAELVSQLIDGNFPDYKVIIPRQFATHTIVSTSAFLKACKQTEIIAREGNNVVRLTVTPGESGPGNVQISAQTEETGSGDVEMDATVEGKPIVIAFNVRFLREVLDVIRTPTVSLDTNTNATPALLKPVGDDNFQHVIMPMHLG